MPLSAHQLSCDQYSCCASCKSISMLYRKFYWKEKKIKSKYMGKSRKKSWLDFNGISTGLGLLNA